MCRDRTWVHSGGGRAALLAGVCLFSWMVVNPLSAGPGNSAIAARLDRVERLHLDSLRSMDSRTLSEIASRAGPARLEERTRELLALDVPAIGARSVDGEGLSPIHRYIMDAAARLQSQGLEFVGSLRTEVAAPVSLDRLLEEGDREAPARVEVGGKRFRVHPIWPNGPMPSLVPEDGLAGPLVYCGDGSWEALKGQPVQGSIALLEFRGAEAMERLFSLGAAAVVVLEDAFIQYENGSYLFSQTPSPFPRFYAEAAVKADLIELASAGTAAPPAVLHGGQIYENRPVESLFYHLPVADASPYTVPEGLLFDWVAAEYGVNTSDLSAANASGSDFPGPGGQVKVPGRAEAYTVPEDGLWGMVARLNDLEAAALKAANPELADGPLLPGMTLAVPSGGRPLAIFVSIDTASVVPDLPHGALQMANVAAALELMEFLATSPRLRLRRDVVFGFLDGDTLGGQASRLAAEYSYLLDATFTSTAATGAGNEKVIERHRAGAEWFSGGAVPGDPAVAQWLLDEWLHPRFEEARIALAEDRITRIVGGRGVEALPSLEAIEDDLARIIALRDATVSFRGSVGERLGRVREAWSGPSAAELEAFGLGKAALYERFSSELAEEARARANQSHNTATARRLREVTAGGRELGVVPALAWKLDLSDGSPHLGIGLTAKLDLRGPLLGESFSGSLSERMRAVAAYAASKAAWPEDFTFLSAEDRAVLSLSESPLSVVYDDFWIHAGYLVLPLGGESDRRLRVDTTADRIERIAWDRFALQARTAFTLIGCGLESLLDTRVQTPVRKSELSRIAGKTVQFNIRSGIDAKEPVPGTYVFLPVSGGRGFGKSNTESFFGYRRGILQRTLLSGSFEMPVATFGYGAEPRIYAYKLDRARAVFTKVATEGQVGTKPQRNAFKYRPGEVVEKNLVLIDVYPRTLFIGTNPSNYTSVIGALFSSNVINLVDAVINGNPRDFAIDSPVADFRETGREAVTIYLPEGERVRVSVQSGLDYLFILPGPIETGEDGKAEGLGIRIGPDPENGERNVLLPVTPLEIAKGMWALAENRLNMYERYGISSRPLREAVERSREYLDSAEAAAASRDWQQAVGDSRAAWGILVKNFPRVLKLGREAVFSVILLMALAVPASWFLERLVIGSKGIVARLGGVTAIFIAATLFLNGFHPAFQIALSPFIIVIAFTMILMSIVVIALSYGRFEVVLRRFRSAGGQVESDEISFMSSLGTAFSLGISNLRKQTFRTALTVFTVTALTFSIVAFVAVRGSDSLNLIPQPIDATVEGRPVEPVPPVYDGFLIRSFNWMPSSVTKVSALMAEFGAACEVTRRAHYMQVEGGNSANREGVNQLLLRHGDRQAVVNAISLFEPNEPRFSGLDRAVSGRTWFEAGDPGRGVLPDRYVVILPDTVAGQLGITAGMLVDGDGRRLPGASLPSIEMMNRSWKVIGILDTGLANRIRDVNGKSLAVVDYLKSGMATNVSSGEMVTEGPSYHMDWGRLAIVPYEAMRDIQAKPRSVAIKVPEGASLEALLEDMAMRLKTEFFAADDGEIFLVVPRSKVDLAGVAKVFLPVILCVLIVMNTMLGTVEERKGEVGMLGAIGLSPRQIAFLMFSESTVFSILGIIFGVFGGLLFSNIIHLVNAGGGTFLSGLSFNFTSMISMVLATGTGLVVLLATLVPARKAAAMAAPSGMAEWELPEGGPGGVIDFDLPFTLTRGNAVGMTAFFNQFLVNHNEPTSEDFNCRGVDIAAGTDAGQPCIEIRTDMWLAPYDLDVAQHFTMRMQAGERESVFVVRLRLSRFSGSEENGRRTAYNLLNLVRRQFLIWRNLEPGRRADFIKQGAELLKEADSPDRPLIP